MGDESCKKNIFSNMILILFDLVDRTDEALPCAVTTLLLNPMNELMKSNMKYYAGHGYSLEKVQPREV